MINYYVEIEFQEKLNRKARIPSGNVYSILIRRGLKVEDWGRFSENEMFFADPKKVDTRRSHGLVFSEREGMKGED